MTTKTSGEIEKEFIDNLKASTKKNLDGWLAEIRGLGITKRNDIINTLKNDYGFGHMNAHTWWWLQAVNLSTTI